MTNVKKSQAQLLETHKKGTEADAEQVFLPLLLFGLMRKGRRRWGGMGGNSGNAWGPNPNSGFGIPGMFGNKFFGSGMSGIFGNGMDKNGMNGFSAREGQSGMSQSQGFYGYPGMNPWNNNNNPMGQPGYDRRKWPMIF